MFAEEVYDSNVLMVAMRRPHQHNTIDESNLNLERIIKKSCQCSIRCLVLTVVSMCGKNIKIVHKLFFTMIEGKVD